MSTRSKARPARGRAVITDQLRASLTRGEHGLYEVARDARVPLSCLTRFVDGQRGLTLATADKLADALGLRLVETGRDRVKASRSPRPRSARVEAHGGPLRRGATAGAADGTMDPADGTHEEVSS